MVGYVRLMLTFFILIALSGQASAVQDGSGPPFLARIGNAILDDAASDANIKDTIFEATVFEFVRHGQVDVIKKLVERGTRLDLRDANGNSLLHIAAGIGSTETARLLIDAGIGVDTINTSNRSPLFIAANANQLEMAKLLLDQKADPNGVSAHNSPLNAAAWYGYNDISTLLLENGARLDQTDSDGNTPLHKAVWQGNVAIVESLLKAGADPDAKNGVRQTPRSMAADRWKEKRGDIKTMRPYGEEQLIGPPNASNGDNPNAWCPQNSGGATQWLMLYYAKPVIPTGVEIYENMGPGTVSQISVFSSNGKEQVAWKGKDPVRLNGSQVPVSRIPLKTKTRTNRIKVYLDINANSDWNEFDAVGLVDKNKKTHWVSWAEASSTYASGNAEGYKFRRIQQLLSEAPTKPTR